MPRKAIVDICQTATDAAWAKGRRQGWTLVYEKNDIDSDVGNKIEESNETLIHTHSSAAPDKIHVLIWEKVD